jgi:signal transduction histidine kinase
VPDARNRTAESIGRAKAELDRALAELDGIRSADPATVGLVAHAMSNYITVTTATVELLQLTLRDHPEGGVQIWLEGIAHAANLMQHSMGRLVAVSTPRDFPLKLDYVNVALLIQRACDYYRRRAEAQRIRIVVESRGSIPLVWADRVALAVVADNLLAGAVQAAPPESTVKVRIAKEPDAVVCTISGEGPGPSGDDGAGHGLEIARDFIERLEGELRCEREPGGGTAVSFRLPATDDEAVTGSFS